MAANVSAFMKAGLGNPVAGGEKDVYGGLPGPASPRGSY